MKRLVLASILTLYTLAAFADDAPTGDFSCFDISSLSTISSEHNGVAINNFMLAEESSLTSAALKQIKFSYSLVNRSIKTAYVSVDLFVTDAGSNPIIAVNGLPPFGMLKSSGADTVNSWTYVTEGTLAKAKRFCARVIITDGGL